MHSCNTRGKRVPFPRRVNPEGGDWARDRCAHKDLFLFRIERFYSRRNYLELFQLVSAALFLGLQVLLHPREFGNGGGTRVDWCCRSVRELSFDELDLVGIVTHEGHVL